MDKAITSLLAVLTFSVWLVYWTGRWYKEWYFKSFSINYASLDFDKLFYLHGSWATILVAISCLVVVAYVVLVVLIKSIWYWKVPAISFGLIAIFILVFWPFKFDSKGSFVQKLLGSKDLCLITLGIIAFIGIAVYIFYHRNQIYPLFNNSVLFFQNHIVATLITVFVLSWIYLAIAGYIMGNYHGHSAIWEGKMGVNWVKHKGAWWIFVIRTNDGRNFLFNRENNISISVRDDEIEEYNGAVSKLPKR
jgi:hypothetical protein